jgi:hypothetical protein
MRFYKVCDRNHPSHVLPTVLWDKRSARAVFRFEQSGIPGVLACDTDDPEVQDMLTQAGYPTEQPQSMNIPHLAMMHQVPKEGEPGHEEIKRAEELSGRREK